jgi:transcriptional regulator with XRE-family HTH domain
MKKAPFTKSNDFKTPAEILKSARQSKGFSIRELAHKAGCSHVHLLKIERGEKQPSPKLLDQLQRELGVGPFLIAYSTKAVGGPSRLSGIDTIDDEIIQLPPGTGTVLALMLDALREGGFRPTLWKPSSDSPWQGSALTIEVDLGTAGRICMPVHYTK